MSVKIDVTYEGDLHCVAIHGPSGDRLPTDAPVDNQGRGEHFSPTDLVAGALGTCMLTIMGLAARNHDIDMTGSRATVIKEMSAVPRRHISKLTVEIRLPARLDAQSRTILERAALGCPVHASLGPDTEVELTFVDSQVASA
ncbi:MAG: OsmC family protein [Candidatus Krumholzibacteriia bacterium]